MIKPVQKDRPFLADLDAVDKASSDLHVWWLGQSGFLVQWKGHRLLFDPYLSDSLTKKYAATEKPHVRMTERVIAPEHLLGIDVVTTSHNHTDHLDHDTLVPLLTSNPEMHLVGPEANRSFIANRIKRPESFLDGLDAGQSIALEPFKITAVPAAHEDLAKDNRGRHHYLGFIAEFGDWIIYHSGDTMLYDGMEAILRQWPIDLAFLPINGRRPERRVAGNLWGREAATLASTVGIKDVIPCHYEMFAFNTESPDEFTEACRRLGQTKTVMKAGEHKHWSKSTSP